MKKADIGGALHALLDGDGKQPVHNESTSFFPVRFFLSINVTEFFAYIISNIIILIRFRSRRGGRLSSHLAHETETATVLWKGRGSAPWDTSLSGDQCQSKH